MHSIRAQNLLFLADSDLQYLYNLRHHIINVQKGNPRQTCTHQTPFRIIDQKETNQNRKKTHTR